MGAKFVNDGDFYGFPTTVGEVGRIADTAIRERVERAIFDSDYLGVSWVFAKADANEAARLATILPRTQAMPPGENIDDIEVLLGSRMLFTSDDPKHLMYRFRRNLSRIGKNVAKDIAESMFSEDGSERQIEFLIKLSNWHNDLLHFAVESTWVWHSTIKGA